MVELQPMIYSRVFTVLNTFKIPPPVTVGTVHFKVLVLLLMILWSIGSLCGAILCYFLVGNYLKEREFC